MSRLIVVGAGDFAREVLWIARDLIAGGTVTWSLGGFLDDDIEGAQRRLRQSGVQLPILGRTSTYAPDANDVFACAIASPDAKLRICESLKERGAKFVNIVHPTAIVAPSARMGVGVVICHHTVISVDVVVGSFVALNVSSSVGHDAVIGDGCTLSAHVDITGHVVVGRGVFLGSHASVLPGVKVEDFSVVGAGSVAIRRVKTGTTVMGVPAKPIL